MGYPGVLHDFAFTDGTSPIGSLTLVGSVLYGMAVHGGALPEDQGYVGFGTIFSINIDGSGFKDMHDFNLTNGGYPWGDLTPVGNVLYGMAGLGGVNGDGIIFSINTIIIY